MDKERLFFWRLTEILVDSLSFFSEFQIGLYSKEIGRPGPLYLLSTLCTIFPIIAYVGYCYKLATFDCSTIDNRYSMEYDLLRNHSNLNPSAVVSRLLTDFKTLTSGSIAFCQLKHTSGTKPNLILYQNLTPAAALLPFYSEC